MKRGRQIGSILRQYGFFHHGQEFIIRHHRVLAFVGGLIISITLVLRDKAQEQSREFNSSISSIQQFARITEAGNVQADQLTEIQRSLRELDLKISGVKSVQLPAIAHAEEKFNQAYAKLNQIEDSLVSMQEFIELVPEGNTSDMEKTLELLQNNVSFHEREFRELPDQTFRSLIENARKGIEPNAEGTNHVLDTVAAYSHRTQELAITRNVLRDQIFGKVIDKQTFFERRAVVASFASYILIAIGFVISLTAHGISKEGDLPELKL